MTLSDITEFGLAIVAALLIAIGHHFAQILPLGWQIILLVLFVTVLFIAYKKLRNKRLSDKIETIRQEMQTKNDELVAELKAKNDELTTEMQTKNDELTAEMTKLKRYNHLRKNMLRVIGEFIKERYRTNFTLTLELKKLVTANNVNAETVKAALFTADNIRREKTKEALHAVVDILKNDTFKKPKDADADNRDKMGVSFYLRVNRSGVEVLEKAYRFFPNELEPKTRQFTLGEGAAGKCWRDNKPVVCENGGEDPLFKEMRDNQKDEYASMICIPANADFIKEKLTEFFGVLTIHSTERKGYFENDKKQFWFDLFQPVCDVVVYSSGSSELIEAIGQNFDAVSSVNLTQG